MKLVDLSHLISNKTITYPSDPNVSIVKYKDIENDGSLLHSFSMGTHTGTHLDVPSHIIKNEKTLNDFSLDNFFGKAICVNSLTYKDLIKSKEKIDGVIYNTGWYKNYNKPKKFYSTERPVIPQKLINSILNLDIKFFGCDLPSVDSSKSKNKPVHNAFMGENIIIYETLNNLNELPLLSPFYFYGFPLPLDSLDGSPVRAVGII